MGHRDTEMFCIIETSRTAVGCLGEVGRVTSIDRGLKTHRITQSCSVLGLCSHRSLQKGLSTSFLVPLMKFGHPFSVL